MSALTLPGTLPGLLRRGSPVVMTAGTITHAGVLLSSGPYGATVAHSNGHNWRQKPVKPWPLERVALDLTDATGRAHAAWWLAGQMKGEPDGGSRVIDGVELLHCEQDGWSCTVHEAGVFYRLDVEYLNDVTLDPREALRLVCLHVAGGGL